MRPSLFWYVTQRWYLFTDVSEQPVGPVFKGQAMQEYRTDRLYRNVRQRLPANAASQVKTAKSSTTPLWQSGVYCYS